MRLSALSEGIQSIFFWKFPYIERSPEKCDKRLLVQQPGAHVRCIGRQSGVGLGSVEIRV